MTTQVSSQDESSIQRRNSLLMDCMDENGVVSMNSSGDVCQAMRRVSMAALPSLQENESELPDAVAERMKLMLTSIRKTNRGCWLGNDDNPQAVHERKAAFRTLSSVPPFSYLPESERHKLVLDLTMFHYKDGDVIIEQGKRDRNVYVITKGRVMLVVLKDLYHPQQNLPLSTSKDDPLPCSFKFLGYLDAPSVVGEYESIFETPRTAQVVAGGKDITAYRMSADRFLQLLTHQAFKLKMALGMRNKGLFKEISSFVTVVCRGALDQRMDFDTILASYRSMVPAIHARSHSSLLDIDGWMYAIRRLPDTVTSTYVYLLSNSVPMPFMHEDFDLSEISVSSVSRRRLAFAVDQGKLLVIMREKFSDVLDFVSLLCAHVHESSKLRLKINKPGAFDLIHGCLWPKERRIKDNVHLRKGVRFYRRQIYSLVSVEEQADALAKLPLSEKEIRGLKKLWPEDFLYRVWDIVAMHENIQVLADFSASYIEASDRWAEHIRTAVVELLQKHSEDTNKEICVSTDLTTHIISSNTTSVRKLLSPYIQKNAAAICKWGIDTHPEIEDEEDLSDTDKLCALCTAYMRAHPNARQEQDEFDASCIKTLRLTELTGIQVELIDLDSLCESYVEHDIEADPYLAPFIRKQYNSTRKDSNDTCGCRRRLLVNIDYAFGKQAEQLISALCLLFGESVASVGVMGKAGGLQGKRGDIVVADYLIHQDGDEMTLIDNTGIDRGALAHLSNRKVLSGGVLTVLGTLLQDNRLLQYYKKLMGCVSLEMEGSYYARELKRFKKGKLLSDDIHLRFLYYISDTPLSSDPSETLAQDLDLSEVIPPQYAVTRELLRLILADPK